MSLIKCAECGKDVSTAATACPNCGAKVAATKQKKPASKLLWGLLGLVAVGTAVMSGVSQKEAKEAEQQDQARLAAMAPGQRASELQRRADAMAAETKKQAEAKQREEDQAKAWNLERAAFSECQVAFEKAAHDPGSVQWVREEERFKYTKPDATAALVMMGVRAKNVMGALTHGNVQCALKRRGDLWDVVSAQQLQ